MPVFYQRTDGSGCYAKASIQGSIVTFQLAERGVARLREAGLEPGGKFPLRLLLASIGHGGFDRGLAAAFRARRTESSPTASSRING